MTAVPKSTLEKGEKHRSVSRFVTSIVVKCCFSFIESFLNLHCKICVQYRAMGPGPNIVDIFSRVDKTKLSNSPANSFTTADWSIYLLISSAKRQVFMLCFNHAEAK